MVLQQTGTGEQEDQLAKWDSPGSLPLAPLCNGAELTGESYWFQFPFTSTQYQSHSVVSRKVGWRTEEMEARRLTFWNPSLIVSKNIANPSTMLQETSHTVDPQ